MDGFLVINGVAVSQLHGYSGGPLPQGYSFISSDVPGIEVGKKVPDVRELKLGVLAARRYEAEVSGVVIGGNRFATDRQSQSMITSTIRMLEELEMRGQQNPSTRWKTMNGAFPVIDLDGLINVALVMAQHVEACFAHEAELAAQIMLAPNPNTVDIDAGWPGTN